MRGPRGRAPWDDRRRCPAEPRPRKALLEALGRPCAASIEPTNASNAGRAAAARRATVQGAAVRRAGRVRRPSDVACRCNVPCQAGGAAAAAAAAVAVAPAPVCSRYEAYWCRVHQG